MDQTPHFPIYMDYGATTPVDPRVVDAMIPWLREHFGNPASRSHAWGWEAEEAVECLSCGVSMPRGASSCPSCGWSWVSEGPRPT